MLTSLLLLSIAQQDSGDVQEKWEEVRAVWDGYVGVTGEMSYGAFAERFVLLRDGRYLVRSKRTETRPSLGVGGLVTVDHFDGSRRIVYSVTTNEYTIENDPGLPNWAKPFRVLWGDGGTEGRYTYDSEQLVVTEESGPTDYIGFVTSFAIPGGGALMLRNRDMTPFIEIRFPRTSPPNAVYMGLYPVCRPLIHERHCDREVEWSLPPGAKLVDRLNSYR